MQATAQQRRARLVATAQAPIVSAVSDRGLAIAAVDVWPLREPVSGRGYTIVRVRTASGVGGFGECAAVSPPQLGTAREALRGLAATAYEVAGMRLAGNPLRGAIDMAMLDAAGKSMRVPVYQMLGGPTRARVRVMASLSGRTDQELASSLVTARHAGFRAFLAPSPAPAARNQGQAFVRHTVRRLAALRAAAGDDADFVVDGAAALSPGDAASLSTALEPFHVLWFDEPCLLANLGAVRKLAAERVTPVGFGRSVPDAAGFQDLLREEAADVLRPDIAHFGITAIRKIAALAETYYCALAPHHAGGPVAAAAALQLAATLPNFFIQQLPAAGGSRDREMRAAISGGWSETIKDGYAELPAGAGLGITANESALEKYRT